MKKILRAASPGLYKNLCDIKDYILSLRYFGFRHFCPICKGHFRKLLPAGEPKRANAVCPRCGSYERHRALWLYLQERTNFFRSPLKMLHIAPEPSFQTRFKKISMLDYLSADLKSPLAMVSMDITDIRYPDDHFDCILCSHVLEHIPDDRKAMKELFRVLKPGGWAILQVPVFAESTYEDATITTPTERLKHFLVEDHVRIYGKDYIKRLQAAGFTVKADPYVSGLKAAVVEQYRLVQENDHPNNKCIYYCEKQ